MAKRSRPPRKPTKLKVLEGTFRKDRSVGNEVDPEVSSPRCPPWLIGEARKEWKRVVPELEKLGILAQLDLSMLVGYVLSWARLLIALDVVAEEGDYYETETASGGRMIRRHPASLMVDQERVQLRQFASEFGLSPAARSRVSAGSGTMKTKGDDAGIRHFGD